MASLRRSLIAEFIGSMFLVIAAIASTILPFNVLGAGMALSILMNAIAVALVLFALIEALGPVSGAHFNPAVTLGMLSIGDIGRGRRAAYYIASQFAGGFVGVIVTHLMFIDTIPTILVISENVKTPGLYFAEFVGTFILMGVIYGCVMSRSRSTGLSVGAVVGGMLITTSSTMYANPTVTFSRMFTYAICGIAPASVPAFVAAEILGAVVASKVFGELYPKASKAGVEQKGLRVSDSKATKLD